MDEKRLMTNAEYENAQRAIHCILWQIAVIDLDGFIERISIAEAAGPILDPSLYRAAAANLQEIKEMANALKPMKEIANRVTGEMTDKLDKKLIARVKSRM